TDASLLSGRGPAGHAECNDFPQSEVGVPLPHSYRLQFRNRGYGRPMKTIGKRAALFAAACMTALAAAASASAGISAHGQLVRPLNANESSNWFGYNQGSLEQGGTLFNSITGDWTVPTVTQHTAGQAENSSDWIGIGGGCVDTGCTVTDSTLIQTGTEQDVD